MNDIPYIIVLHPFIPYFYHLQRGTAECYSNYEWCCNLKLKEGGLNNYPVFGLQCEWALRQLDYIIREKYKEMSKKDSLTKKWVKKRCINNYKKSKKKVAPGQKGSMALTVDDRKIRKYYWHSKETIHTYIL